MDNQLSSVIWSTYLGGSNDDAIYSSVRFGLGRFNTKDRIEYAAKRTIEEYKRLAEFALV